MSKSFRDKDDPQGILCT